MRAAVQTAHLEQVRQAGARRFAELGLPTSKHEDWRYSNIGALAQLPLPAPARPAELQTADLAVSDAGARVFLIDGYCFIEASSVLPAGATVISLATALAEHHPATRWLGELASPESRALTALNAATLQDGVLIDIAPDVELARPIHVVHVTRGQRAPAATHPRVLVRAGEGARATVIESFVGRAPESIVNAVTEIRLERGATLEHLRWVHGGTTAHVGATGVAVERDGRYRLHDATSGTGLAREEIRVSLRGEGAEASLGGLLLGRGDQWVDHEVVIEHAAAHTRSEQLFKTILDDRATGTFAGKVVVQSGARGTNAEQRSRALLLSERARANAKPQLEIYTDDVRCTHGATSGQLDRDALFYLRARGLNPTQAEHMLTLAFAGEWFERIRDPELREAVGGWVRDWLEPRSEVLP